MAWLGALVTHHPLMAARGSSDELNRRLLLLLLDICGNPQGALPAAVAGAWIAIGWGMMGRPLVTLALVEAGLFEVAAAHLHKSSPVEWVNWRCPAGLQAGVITFVSSSLAMLELPGVNKVQLLVDSGMADAIASLLKVHSAPPHAYTRSLVCDAGGH